jgi:hypothetical protein
MDNNQEKEPKEHLTEWMVRIIDDNDRAGKPARDAIRMIVYALVHEVSERGGPAQIQTLKIELQRSRAICRRLGSAAHV